MHYDEFNKRLDEWVPATRIDLDREVEWPPPEKPDKKAAKQPQKTEVARARKQQQQQRSRSALDRDVSSTPESSAAAATAATATPAKRLPRRGDKDARRGSADATGDAGDEDGADVVDVQAAAAAAAQTSPRENWSREDEIEKLRTGGSLTQNRAEISRVRNLSRIQMGKFEMEPWYFSPYPPVFAGDAPAPAPGNTSSTDVNGNGNGDAAGAVYLAADVVYICEFCLGYWGDDHAFARHRAKCGLMHPPGNEIYRDDHVSFFEIDGRRQRTWCRNLCLLSKLFLDHKTLYYDVDPFLFYCMCTRDAHGYHLVGYFSKEKESAEGYNVACILTLPQFQRKGYGRLLIAFSYELSKREGRLGSPEKPLSDLGLLGYRTYWQETIVDLLAEGRTEASVDDLATVSAMTTNDVLHTLQYSNMLRYSVCNATFSSPVSSPHLLPSPSANYDDNAENRPSRHRAHRRRARAA